MLSTVKSVFRIKQSLGQRSCKRLNFGDSAGKDVKGMVSVVVYVISIPLAFWNGWVAMAVYLAVAVMWMVPDNRIERLFGDEA